MKKPPTAPRAEYATKEVTALMTEYCDWVISETGYTVDPVSVMLGSSLRTAFQAERRAEKQANLDAITVPKKSARTPSAADRLTDNSGFVEVPSKLEEALKKVSQAQAVDPGNIDADPTLDDPKRATDAEVSA